MTLWDRIGVIFSIGTFSDERGAGDLARRWSREAKRDPDLKPAPVPQLTADLINMGGILAITDTGKLDPNQRLAYEAGRRDLALQLLAMKHVGYKELNHLLGDNDE